jgi:uncharacterized repeat protein (TIGR01451 family)
MKPTSIFVSLTLATLFCTSLGFTQQPSEPPESGDMIRRRMEWFYNQRAFPLRHIPVGARLRALRQLDQMPAEEAQPVIPNSDISPQNAADISPSTGSSTQWTLIGPQPTDTPYNDPIVAGRVTALAVDPTNSNVVYAGAAEGGVWKTTDGGVHWTPLTDTQPSLAVGSIAIDPSNHSTIYVGTGEENYSNDSYYGEGILKSTNGGTSWTQIKGPFVGPLNELTGGAFIGAIAVDPGNSAVILVGVRIYLGTTGVYRTEDGGTTWTSALSKGDGRAVVFDPSNGNIAYAAVQSAGVYKSFDAGKTWAPIPGTGSNVLPNNVARIALGIAPSAPSTLYAGVQDANSNSLLGVFKTVDGGANWVKLVNAPDYCAWQCSYNQAIAVDPDNANVVFAGGFTTMYRSTDGGSNWTNVIQGANGFSLHADLHALAFSSDSSVIYAGNDGGVWSANAPTATPVPWTELNDTLAITQFYFSPSINPQDVTNSFGGTQDNGTQRYGGAMNWGDVVCGDGGWTAIDPLTPSNVYSSCWPSNGVVWRSTGGGIFGSWSRHVGGINLSDRMAFLPPLAIDTLHPANLYFGTYRVYQTTNRAHSWTAISGTLTPDTLTTIAVAPTDSNTVYAGASGSPGDSRVFVTTNALAGVGSGWTDRSNGLPPRFLTHIAVDPHSSTSAYVAYSGFSGFVDSLGHIFRTIDGGVTWKDVSGNLPNIPINAIVIDPILANTYYAATDIGVFRTRNAGSVWSVLGAGLPRVAVLGLTLHDSSRTLRAATHGRSMWDIHVPIADLVTSLTESPNPVPHGTNLTYTLNVTNQGPDIAANTVVSDATPVGTTFVGYTTSSGSCTTPAMGATGTVKCKVGSLANGATATIMMTVKDTTTAGTSLTNRGSASSATPDPNINNNSMTVKTQVD